MLKNELSHCYRRNEDILCKEIEGELYLIDTYRRKFMQINPVGLEIWRLLDGEYQLSSVIAIVEEKFDCNAADARRDAASFISELQKRELVF